MILDSLSNSMCYAEKHPLFQAAFDFLADKELDRLPPGKYILNADSLYAVVSRDEGRGRDAARLEAHRRYIDIQFVAAGEELIGWRDLSSCRTRAQAYDSGKDIEFFADEPERWVSVPPGSFAIFFPEDAHAPLAGCGPVRKVVVKVAAG